MFDALPLSASLVDTAITNALLFLKCDFAHLVWWQISV